MCSMATLEGELTYFTSPLDKLFIFVVGIHNEESHASQDGREDAAPDGHEAHIDTPVEEQQLVALEQVDVIDVEVGHPEHLQPSRCVLVVPDVQAHCSSQTDN